MPQSTTPQSFELADRLQPTIQSEITDRITEAYPGLGVITLSTIVMAERTFIRALLAQAFEAAYQHIEAQALIIMGSEEASGQRGTNGESDRQGSESTDSGLSASDQAGSLLGMESQRARPQVRSGKNKKP